eukprot:Skav231266  [mRNA]  locus=scaffold2436:179940:194374:+ [translate_table: standard]
MPTYCRCLSVQGAENSAAQILADAFKRHRVRELGSPGYCAEWASRTLLDGLLHRSGVHSLHIDEDFPIVSIPGPDESGHLQKAAKLFQVSTASNLWKAVHAQGSIHLLSMKFCLHLSMGRQSAIDMSQKMRVFQAAVVDSRRPEGESELTAVEFGQADAEFAAELFGAAGLWSCLAQWPWFDASSEALLLGFSPVAVAVLVITAIPPFIAGVKFAGDAFQLARRQTSGFREQIYLERVMAMDAPAKEVKLFGLGPWLLKRYRNIFDSFFKDTSNLALKQGSYGFLLELISTSGLYLAFAWVAMAAVRQQISLGDMTMRLAETWSAVRYGVIPTCKKLWTKLCHVKSAGAAIYLTRTAHPGAVVAARKYLLIFQEGQQAFSSILRAIGNMYADNLYLSNLYEFLDYKVQSTGGTATSGPTPGDGVRFDDVWFRYPGANEEPGRGDTGGLVGGDATAPGKQRESDGHRGH